MCEPVHALLLSAGLSTRLAPLSDERPKPLLPVCNRPLLEWAVAHVRSAGLTEVIVNLHHLGDQIRAFLGDGQGLGVRASYSPEARILGTGGGIRAMAERLPRGLALVMNAKIVCDLDLRQVIEAHLASGALATLVLRPDPRALRWGAVWADPEGQVVRMLDAEHPTARGGEPCLFTGIHLLSPELLDQIPEGESCIVRQTYLPVLRAGGRLHAVLHRGYFYEHSTPSRYLQGNLNLVSGLARPGHAPGPLSGVDPSAEVHSQAHLVPPLLVGAGCRIEAGARVGPLAVLGEGSVVRAGLNVTRAVVWPGAVVDTDAVAAVVTPRTRVSVPEQDDPEAAPR